MQGFVQGADRQQTTLLPECLDDWIDESNSIRAVDVFVEALDLRDLGFEGVDPAATGRPAYHPSPMLKLYIYGYLNRVQSSRRLEREAGRNVEVMWLTGRLAPDHKTIADFRKDNGPAIKKVYVTKACRTCRFKDQCTTSNERRVKRWEHEHVVEAAQTRLAQHPSAMRVRRETVEHPFATLKMRIGATHFLMKRLPNVATEMALNVLSYNLTRVLNIVGVKPLLAAMRA